MFFAHRLANHLRFSRLPSRFISILRLSKLTFFTKAHLASCEWQKNIKKYGFLSIRCKKPYKNNGFGTNLQNYDTHARDYFLSEI